MNKKQRMVILVIVLLIVGYGTLKDEQRDLSFYVLRTIDGVTFVKDENPTFTHKAIKKYDPVKKELYFTDAFKNRIESGAFMDHQYIFEGTSIKPEVYKFHGISTLGAKYPDRFVFEIEGKEVINGYFETSIYSSYMPPGDFIIPTDNGIRIVEGFNKTEMLNDVDVLALYFGNL